MGITEKTIIFITLFIVLILFIFLAWYFSHKAKHKEHIMLIEKGIDIDKLKEKGSFTIPWLKLGIVVLGISVGLLIISVLANNDLLRGSGALPVSILGICGGISLVLANYVNKK